MLKARVLTALSLLAFLLPSLFYSSAVVWAVLATLIVSVAAWEWFGLMLCTFSMRCLGASLLVLLCAGLLLIFPEMILADQITAVSQILGLYFYVPAFIFWCGLVPFWLRYRWSLRGFLWASLVGGVVLLPTWLAFIQLRQRGATVLLAAMAVAWVADIAAYLVGRLCGRQKLAPTISPGKTWAGAYGAAVGVQLYGVALAVTISVPKPMLAWCVLLLAVLTILSIVGDLFESLLKRLAGVKDSSGLLPGHGGVLDRIDSQTAVLPVVALAMLLFA